MPINHNSTRTPIYPGVRTPLKLEQIQNVNTTNGMPDKAVLRYNARTGLWEPDTITSGAGNQTDLSVALAQDSTTIVSSTGDDAVIPAATASSAGVATATQISKLNNIQSGATVNSPDNQLRDRATHTGTQTISTVAGLQTALDSKVNSSGIKTVNGNSLLGTGDIAISGGASNLTLTNDATTVSINIDTGTDVVIPAATTTLAGVLTGADKTKLNGVATGATANATDAQLRDRSTHTGTQAISTVTGLQGSIDAKQDTLISSINIKSINGNSILGAGNLDIANVSNLSMTNDATTVSINIDTGTDIVIPAATTTTAGVATGAQITKLGTIAAGATANATDSALRDRTTHTGVQDISTVSGLQVALDSKLATTGIKTVNGNSLVGTGDIAISGGASNLSMTTSATTIGINIDTGTDVVIPAATGTVAGVMAAADKTKLDGIATGATVNATDAQLRDRSTHTGTQLAATIGDSTVAGRALLTAVDVVAQKTSLAINNVDNTSDANKPVSTATATALSGKQATLVSAINIKTVNGNSLLGAGDIAISGGASNLTLTNDATTVSINIDTGTDVVIPAATTSLAGVLTGADKTKLNGVATGATANATDAQLRDRSTHTGTQLASTISDFNAAVNTRLNATSVDALLDVSVTSPTVGQVLKYNGTTWVNDVDNTSGGAGSTNLSTTTSATTLTVVSDTGTDAILPVATTSISGVLSAADKTKLDGIATGATANAADSALRDRSTHTGTQLASTIGDSTVSGRAILTAVDAAAQRTALGLGTAATAASSSFAPSTGILKTALETAVQTSLGKADTALQTAPVTTVAGRTGAIVLTSADVGLGSVDNTSDAAKPISTATATALSGKQATLVSATNIKTVNGNSLLGSGDITISGGTANLSLTNDATTVSVNIDTGTDVVIPPATTSLAGVMVAADKTKLNGIATAATANATDASLRDRSTHTGTQLAATIGDSTVAGRALLTATDVAAQKTALAINNVDNTSDANKPVSTATATALSGKQATLVSATNIKTVNGNSLLGAGDIAISNVSNLSLTNDATTVSINIDTGTDVVIPAATTSLAGVLTGADKTKLNGIATGATANATDALLRDRSTHTGTQLASTVSDFSTAADARIGAASINALGDVVITTATTGQVIKFDGTNWVNGVDANVTNLTTTTSATTATIVSDTGTDAVIPVATGSIGGLLSAADKTKLDGVATGAAALGSVAGAALGAAAAGVATTAARSDHVHAAPTTVSGNAGTATTLQTARTISLSGDVTGSVSFNGSANADIAATIVDDSHNHTTSTITNFNATVDVIIGAKSIDALADVNTTGATAGKVLQYDGAMWTPVTPSAGSSVAYANVRFVSTTGNDGTAVLGDMTKPYLNVKTAVDACVAGDTVMLLPGNHTGVAPLILKNGCTLTSLMGKSLTKLKFPGTFPIQGGTSTTTHGGHIQPSTGVQGVDACYVNNLHIELLMDGIGTYAAVTGVNTATGTAVTGTGATYSDMYVSNCSCIGLSDVHFIIDAKQRTYFKDCYVESAFDWCHLIAPNNISNCEFESCKLVWRPWYDNNTFIGPALGGWWRIRSGELTIRNCNVEIWNDGRTDWVAYNIGVGDPCGGVVDNFAGATVRILGGLPFKQLGVAWPIPMIPRFTSTGSATAVSAGSVIVDQAIEGLCDYNADGGANVFARSVRVVPLSDMTLKATVFAGAATGKRNNTYKCDTAAVTQTFSMFTLPPNTVVKRAWIGVKTAFSGGAGTATTVEVGTAATSTKYLAATNIRAAALTMGTNVMTPETYGDTLTGTGTLVTITVRNTGANVSTLTAGEVDVFVELAGTSL